MDPNNRLHLNFGYNDRNFQSNDRAYPTTPSTFPQPVFPAQGGQETWGQQTPNGYPNAGGYFMNNPYPPQYQQQQNHYAQQNLQSPQASYQQRQGGFANNDGTNGLVHQFSHQNLGGAARQGAGYGRQPSPNPRPKPGPTNGQSQYSGHLSPPVTGGSHLNQASDDLPERNPDKYSSNLKSHGTSVHERVQAFFKENVQRARDRNARLAFSTTRCLLVFQCQVLQRLLDKVVVQLTSSFHQGCGT